MISIDTDWIEIHVGDDSGFLMKLSSFNEHIIFAIENDRNDPNRGLHGEYKMPEQMAHSLLQSNDDSSGILVGLHTFKRTVERFVNLQRFYDNLKINQPIVYKGQPATIFDISPQRQIVDIKTELGITSVNMNDLHY